MLFYLHISGVAAGIIKVFLAVQFFNKVLSLGFLAIQILSFGICLFRLLSY